MAEERSGSATEEDTVTDLSKGRRITGGERSTLGRELRSKYEAGASIRELADETGRSYGFVHGVLLDSGATLRGRGGSKRTKVKP